ncbi:MAG: fibronectin type III domain-containing protein [Balneolaceae bacterium]|nr:fibronectin type III domain-containing protein [Balneolaceae bacterium]
MYTKAISTFLLLIFFVGSVSVSTAQTAEQTDGMVNWTAEGMVVFITDAIFSPEQPNDGWIGVELFRTVGEGAEFERIAEADFPETQEEFFSRATTEILTNLYFVTETETENELWQYVQENPRLSDYGFLAFEPDLWRALGTAYFDDATAGLREGVRVTYRLQFELEDGSTEILEDSAIVGAEPAILSPSVVNRIETEERVGGTWASPLEGSEDAFYARIFRQKNMENDFEELPDLLFARRTDENLIVYQWEEEAEPEHTYRYYIQPIDMLRNAGPLSDTLTVISVDFESLPLIGDVDVEETPDGILLSWEPVPNKSYITGVEVRRSRDSRDGYIVMDTLQVLQNQYLDSRLMPNVTYYYELRVVTTRDRSEMPSGIASGSFRNEGIAPSPPAGLRATQEGTGIRLNWEQNAELDLFGYYVYRGTSTLGEMEVISDAAIEDSTTFFDDYEGLHGRTNYVYAIRAMNRSEQVSDYSEPVIIRPDRVVRPPAPVGVSGYAEQNRIRLSWNDAQQSDESVFGYNLYRGTAPVQNHDSDRSASETAEINNFRKLNEEPISGLTFDDPDVNHGETYYYAVSSVDAFGEESVLSNESSFSTIPPSLLAPSQVSVRTVSNGVELRWNRTMQAGAQGYRIYRRAVNDETAVAIQTLNLDETRYLDTTVSSGTRYWYSVSVLSDESESSRSTEQTVSVN